MMTEDSEITLQKKAALKDQQSNTTTVSFRGFEFDYNDDIWVLNRNIKVNVGFIRSLDQQLSADIIETLVYFAEGYSAGYTSILTKDLKRFFNHSEANIVSVSSLVNYKNSLSKSEEPRIAVVRTFLRQMRYLQLDCCISNDIFEVMGQWRLYGGDRGVPVLSLCPESGPFSDIEFDAIGMKMAHKYAESIISATEYSLIALFKATGRRPEQISCLKVKDFILTSKHIAKLIYAMNIPRIKQRGGKFRSSFRAFGLVEAVGQILIQHIKQLIAVVERSIGRKLSKEEKAELPLFLTEREIKTIRENSDGGLLNYLKTELCHMTALKISKLLIKAIKKLKITSERTGKLIKANPYRFRYTLGTRAAREGAGTITIATLLDHSDNQHTGVYVENVPEFAIEISAVMNQSLMRYATAFAGRVVSDEEDATKENAGATRIPCHEKDCDVGSCGTNAFCTDYAPIACYLCPKFRPWADAPHHLILEWLMEERKRLKEESIDMAIVSINDRAIIAVCQVIKACKEFNDNV